MANGMDMKNNECRDFMRGVCGRGNNCKFFHPPHVNPMTQHQEKLPICKDFQNKGCDRVKCKFLHITQQEEVEYDSTGNLPAHGGRSDQARNHGVGVPPGGAGSRNGGGGGRNGGGPFPPSSDACKDFLNGVCQRGNRCKFRHDAEEAGPMYGKRRRNDFAGPPGGGAGGFMGGPNPLAEENEMLRRKIADLQRQVVDLRQMNDTLYEQNSRYRTQLRGGPAGAPISAAPAAAPRTNNYQQYSSYDGYSKF